jgi:hypothetical protein
MLFKINRADIAEMAESTDPVVKDLDVDVTLLLEATPLCFQSGIS